MSPLELPPASSGRRPVRLQIRPQLVGLRQALKGLRVVQPVGQLRGDDPGIGGRYRRRHLAGLAAWPPAEPIECHVLGYHRRDSGAEAAPQRGQRVRGVLDRVVQDCCAQRLIVDFTGFVEPGEDRRDGYRMGDVRIAAPAHLALMAPGGDLAGPLDQLGVSALPRGQDDLTEFRDQATPGCARTRHRTVHRDPPRQACSASADAFAAVQPGARHRLSPSAAAAGTPRLELRVGEAAQATVGDTVALRRGMPTRAQILALSASNHSA
jgi:hypothetical protein